MGEVTGIGWTDMTFNAWEGCTKVGPGCTNCYAETRNVRFAAGANWGAGAPRRRTSEHNRNNLARWNRAAAAAGRSPWVFCSSLSDVLDNEVDPAWRRDLFDRIREASSLRVQIVTKRIGNLAKMVPPDWGTAFRHCGVIVTVVDQDEAERDIPKLLRAEAPWRGISYEPALGPIDLRRLRIGEGLVLDALTGSVSDARGVVVERLPALDWVIAGGESGPAARAFDPAWAEAVVEACRAAGVAVFVKQMGSAPVGLRLAHRKGEDPAEWPEALRVREMPVVYDPGGRLAA